MSLPESIDPAPAAEPGREGPRPTPRPVILAVDDEPTVLGAVVRDLRRRYGADHRILRADSGEAALEMLRDLRLRDEPVALLVVDQRMPGMTGVELLRGAAELHPDARKVLLTAYADTDVAIRAINEIRLDHYLLKPWDPPEEHLYPVLTDLLDAWRGSYRRPFEGVRVLSHRWSTDAHRIRDFLARNLMPYRWLDVEADPEATDLLELAGVPPDLLPVVFFPDGSHLARPDNAEIAARMGLHTTPTAASYDLVIVGAGPAGLAAAVYGASEGLRTLLIEREAPGGQAGMSSSIENYLGFPVGLSGSDLARRAVAQAARFGAEILTAREATALRVQGGYPVVTLTDGTELAGQALVVATGVAYRLLDLPDADRLAGAGLYYGAAITEALSARGKDVFVLGGGNSAGQAAIYLAASANSVTVLARSELRTTMSRYLVDRIESTDNIRVRARAEVAGVHGERALEAVTVLNLEDRTTTTEPAAALFVFIGAAPRTEWVAGLLGRDRQGYLLTGPDLGGRGEGWTVPRDPFWLESNVPGIFVAGDVRHRSIKRVASAVGEGAMAIQFVHQHLSGLTLARPGSTGGRAAVKRARATGGRTARGGRGAAEAPPTPSTPSAGLTPRERS